jgi:hypothetical protein
VKAKGLLGRVGKYYMTSKTRFLAINPVQGTLIKFKKETDYPYKPREIFKLNEISQPHLVEEGWFRKKNNFYFAFEDETSGQRHVFFAKEKRTIENWIEEITGAQKYFKWITYMTRKRDEMREKEVVERLEKILCTVIFAQASE